MRNKISTKVKNIIKDAFDEAKSHGDSKLKASHILITLILNEKSEIHKIFTKKNVDIDALMNDIAYELNASDLTYRGNDKREDISISLEVKEIFKSMDVECTLRGDREILEKHLMLGLLNTDSVAKKILNKININYNSVNRVNYMNYNDEHLEENMDNSNSPMRNKKNKTVKGKTPALDKFCNNITNLVENDKVDPVVGRVSEIRRVSSILSRRKKNNPILIGEPGVGKTAIVEGLAKLIFDGSAPKPLLDKRIYSLDLASIVAGTKYRGQFEERMKQIIQELKTNDDIILFIDEIHTIVGAGNASGSLDASNIFKPALARGEIQVIGATTLDEFRENIEKDGALTRRFQQVLVNEPSVSESIEILNNIKENYEVYHNVSYSDEIIEEIVKLSHRYINGRAMPDNAIDVMDEIGAMTNIDTKIPEELKKLKEKIDLLVKEKNLIVTEQRYEDAAKLRDKEEELKVLLKTKKEEWTEKEKKNSTIITTEMVLSVISTMTGIPLNKLGSEDIKKLKNLENELKGEIIGQDDAVTKVSKAIKRSRLGIKPKNKPIGSFIFLGSTGVGKTYLAKLLADKVFGDSEALVRVDMSEYMEKHAMSKLIGSPPGYVGYGEGGKLTEAIRRKPYSIVLFDEIEKAHDDIFNLLLQILDEGFITDSLGRKVDFKNTMIILTSNIGVNEVALSGKHLGYKTESTIVNENKRIENIINKALKKKFKPEFLNRIDNTIVFNPLELNDVKVIVKNELTKFKAHILESGIKVELTPSAIEFLAKEGYDKEYGARPLNRAIQKYIEDPLADEMIEGRLEKGDTIKFGYGEKNGITIKINKNEDTN